jgi:hypothetical protein
MNRFPVVGRPSILIFVAIVMLALVGGAPAVAEEPAPSAPVTLESLFADPNCADPASPAAVLPGLAPEALFMGEFTYCSPQCGNVGCRGAVLGFECLRINGTQGHCNGPSLGKKCLDGLPMCTCA